MAEKVKLGIIGCGGVLHVMFGPIFKYLPNGTLVAACDADPAQLERAKEYGTTPVLHPGSGTPIEVGDEKERHEELALYTDYRELLADDNVDAVIVGSPVFHHAEHAVAVAEAGKHVFLEKPMARTLEECDTVIAACKKNNVKLMVGFMKRFDKSYRLAAEIVKAGTLGRIVEVRSDWSWWGRDAKKGHWRTSLETWGGQWQDHGSHVIDQCRQWLGEVTQVYAEIRIQRPEVQFVDDHSVVTMWHESGAVVSHHQTITSHKPHREYFIIDGVEGSLEIDSGPEWTWGRNEPFQMTLWRRREAKDVTPKNDPDPEKEVRAHARYLKEMEHFCDSVLHDKEPVVNGAAGRKAIEAILASFISADTGRRISLPLTEKYDLPAIFKQMHERSPGHDDADEFA